MERSNPSSGRSITPADINWNGWPTSIRTGGRHQSECPADIIGIRTVLKLIGYTNTGPAPANRTAKSLLLSKGSITEWHPRNPLY